ncbi:MAG: hypothetical protein HYV42_03375 [Candidatus Magasanikbacteria bacterium]|nr:hypothetical protein [Candidatus Magasanikbacteria bacterium]
MPIPAITPAEESKHPSGSGAVHDLLEKNLKWSQIIYEQNRKISRRLTWLAVGSWLRLLILLTPIILGLIFLPPLVRKARCAIIGGAGCPQSSPTAAPFGLPLSELQRLLPQLQGEAAGAVLKQIQR